MNMLRWPTPAIEAPHEHRSRLRVKPAITFGLCSVLALGPNAVGAAGAPATRSPHITSADMTWGLTNSRVVNPGATAELRQGTYIRNYTVVTKATAKGGDLIPSGLFRLTLSAFSPKVDLPGQRAGYWYIEGKWTITDVRVSATKVKARAHSRPGLISGRISAELPFDPTSESSPWTAVARLPMTRIASVTTPLASRTARGDGTLTLSKSWEGTLALKVDRWPTQPSRRSP